MYTLSVQWFRAAWPPQSAALLKYVDLHTQNFVAVSADLSETELAGHEYPPGTTKLLPLGTLAPPRLLADWIDDAGCVMTPETTISTP